MVGKNEYARFGARIFWAQKQCSKLFFGLII